MAFHLASIARIKNFYLKGVLIIYIIAFTSLYLQVPSLFGDNGVVPIRDFMAKTGANKKAIELQSIIALAPKLGLGYGVFVELLCVVSIILAMTAMVVRRFANALTFGFLWYVYYSICLVGQGFMSFHSDLLLLEVGFITILLAPLLPTSRMSQSDHDHMTFFLVKWLTFRYFVSNVLNVYLDNDEAWYKMTAIPMVAHSVQFPSLLTWHVFNLPPQYTRVYQAYEHSVKLCAPFLMLLDLKYSRKLGFYTLLFVAIPSAVFFNFGWTDLLIIACLFSYLKDAYSYYDKRAQQSGIRSTIDIICVLAYISTVVAIMVKYYGMRYEGSELKVDVKFTPAQFKLFADHMVPVSLVFGILGLLSATYTTFFNSTKKTSIVKTLIYTIIVILLFLSTFPTMTRFSPGLENKIKPLTFTKDLSRFVAPYQLSNNYILLSKVSTFYAGGRPELQIQGRASSEESAWQQFDMKYKPGSPSRGFARVLPHLPRLDLKMWYAARSSLQNNQWLQNYVYRLATKEKDVTATLARDVIIPPVNQVRVVLMTYKLSTQVKQTSGHWSETKFKSEYMPTTTIDNLKFNVKSNGISLTPPSKVAVGPTMEKMVSTYLEVSRNYITSIEHTIIIWSLIGVTAFWIMK